MSDDNEDSIYSNYDPMGSSGGINNNTLPLHAEKNNPWNNTSNIYNNQASSPWLLQNSSSSLLEMMDPLSMSFTECLQGVLANHNKVSSPSNNNMSTWRSTDDDDDEQLPYYYSVVDDEKPAAGHQSSENHNHQLTQISSSSTEVGGGGGQEDSSKTNQYYLPIQCENEDEKSSKKLSKAGKKKKKEKKERDARFAFITKSEVDNLEDGYRWRKYGQKAVKNSSFPRSYYRCTSEKCGVKKRVERSFEDPTIVITTYEGQHTHLSPATLRSNAALSIFSPNHHFFSSSSTTNNPTTLLFPLNNQQLFFPHQNYNNNPNQITMAPTFTYHQQCNLLQGTTNQYHLQEQESSVKAPSSHHHYHQ